MLNESQKGQLRTALETERARLIENAKDGLQFSMNRERNIGRDSIDESMEEEIFSTELRLRDREKFLLGKIDEALRRIEENTINECEDCAEEIGFKRLLARPVTTYCIDCKEEREREEQSQAQQAGRSGGGSREDIGGSDELSGGNEE
ncbi:MAG: transcriptional regulator, TraR/DksA family [Myxococcales bacterium]|nr:transcriptional regulator, TraR/DksA family [Myxococcales bacterium]